jgi:hypothetical protein
MLLTLIPNWRKAFRMFSIQAMSAAILVQSVWGTLDSDMRASIPVWCVRALTVALLLLGIVGRLVDQPKVQHAPDAPAEEPTQ